MARLMARIDRPIGGLVHQVRQQAGLSCILVASLDDVIRSKEAADRARVHATLPLLYALRDEIERD